MSFVFPGRARHFDQTLVAVIGDGGPHAYQRLALEAAADPFHLRGDGHCLETADPASGDFVRLPGWIVFRILHLVHAGGEHPTHQTGERGGAWSVQGSAAVPATILVETNHSPP